MKCQTCEKSIPYSTWKKQCLSCFKASKNPTKTPAVDQSTCSHNVVTEQNRSTSSGAMLIHETVCQMCGKVLSHTAEDIPYELQYIHSH